MSNGSRDGKKREDNSGGIPENQDGGRERRQNRTGMRVWVSSWKGERLSKVWRLFIPRPTESCSVAPDSIISMCGLL